MQNDLDTLSDWEKTWAMEFHPDKCEVISITRNKNPVHHPYTLHGQQLKHVKETKYLGLTITHDLRWNKHVEKTVSKANNSLNFLRRNLRINNIPLKLKAYKSLVRPLLEYSCSVWDPYTDDLINKVELVQHRAARFCVNNYARPSSSTNKVTCPCHP